MLRQIRGSVYSFARSHSFLLSFLFLVTKEYHNWQLGGRREAEALKKEKMGQDRAQSSIPHLLPHSPPRSKRPWPVDICREIP